MGASRRPTAFRLVVQGAVPLLLLQCQQPTEVTLALSTDVQCAQFTGVTIAVGSAADIEAQAPATTSQSCTPSGDLGTLVVVPSQSRNAEVDIKIVAGVNRDPTSCVAPDYGTGCIVARRSLQYIPHTPLELDIVLSEACNGVVCPVDQTCVEGACTSAAVSDPGACATPRTCGEGALTPTSESPQPPSPLVCGDSSGLQAGAAWPMLGFCPTHIGRGPTASAQTNHVQWTYTAAAGLESGVAIAADGTIYAGASDGNVYAIDPGGTVKWTTPVGAEGFANAVPAIAQDGSVYLGNDDANLYALAPTGAVRWRYDIGGKIFTSPNVGGDGTIYVGGGTGEHKAFALNDNGTQKWQFGTGGDVQSSPALGFDSTVYFGSEDENLYALVPGGTEKWLFYVNEGTQTPVVGTSGAVYFNGKHSVCAVDSGGSLLWATQTNGNSSIPSIGADGTVYAGTDAGAFYAFDGTSGKIKWQLPVDALDSSNQAIIGGDGTLYVGATSGKFYALTSSGSVLWTLTTGGAIHGPAAIGADGTLYFGSDDDKLYAVGP
jgi:outer membrane protein assembly factor BamB